MSAQIIPFQTQEHRTLANAFAYYRFIKADRAHAEDLDDQRSIISSAVYAAVADERWGPDWRDDPEIKKAMDRENTNRFVDAFYGHTNWALKRWDQYARRLELQLAMWLDGRPPRLRQRKPLRPPRRRSKGDSPLAQVIPFSTHCAGNAAEAAAK